MIRILEFRREKFLEDSIRTVLWSRFVSGSRRTYTYGFLGIKGLFVEPIVDAVLVLN